MENDGKKFDPTGLRPEAPGAKLDAGKVRVGLMMEGFANALWAVAEVSTYGAKKYSPGGWQHVPDGETRYLDAQMRHILEELSGEEYDEESELLHAAHSAWNSLARLELMLRKLKNENSPN